VLKREGIIFLVCFLVVLLLNIIRVCAVRAPAAELFTQIPALLIVALVIYGAGYLLRLIYGWMGRFWNRHGSGEEKERNDE
jgi:hypothetical protein